MAAYQLPARDELGFCNILLSALGGDGANMSAKLLFKIGCTEFGLDGGYDARYGSEKKGTATDVSVRFCDLGNPVRQAGPTNRPHFLVVFHENMIEPCELYRGLHPGAVVIVNSTKRPADLRPALHLHSGRIVCVDATRIAFEVGGRLNMPLLAALAHELRFPDEAIKRAVVKQWPRAEKANLTAYEKSVAEAASAEFAQDGFALLPPTQSRGAIGWRNMLNGGTVDALTHTTAGRDNRIAAQGRVPRFDPAACNSCSICMTVCSDPGGLMWQQGRLTGVDDRFCKGCMRCVEVCPPTKKGKGLTTPEEAVA
ncbi:MAG: 2-oxoacid:acceptor oxidoreductase family protein [Phycisphaerae bacterium]